jgi:colanic acid/amylovoran biosynthesis glycosyltransferase
MTERLADHDNSRQQDIPAHRRPVIAQVLDGYPYRGQQYVYDLIFNLNRFRSVVLARRHLKPKQYLDESKWRAKKVRSPWKSRWIAGAVNRISPAFSNDYFARFVARDALAHEAKAIHVHYGLLAANIVQSPNRYPLPVIVSLYGSAWRAVAPEWNERYRRFFAVCDRVVVECDATAELVLRAGCPPDKLRTVHLGIDTEGEFPFVQRPPDGITRFLIVARFIAKKGYPYLLDAFARLARENPQVSLTVVGFGKLKNWIEQRSRELGVSDKLEIVDTTTGPSFSETLRSALASHDVFLYPSVIDQEGDYEGTAICLMAAQASGLPTIATPIGGNEEVIREGGILVPPGDVEALAEQMIKLAGQSQLRQQLSQSGRKYAVREFSLTRQIKRLEDVYLEFM